MIFLLARGARARLVLPGRRRRLFNFRPIFLVSLTTCFGTCSLIVCSHGLQRSSMIFLPIFPASRSKHCTTDGYRILHSTCCKQQRRHNSLNYNITAFTSDPVASFDECVGIQFPTNRTALQRFSIGIQKFVKTILRIE